MVIILKNVHFMEDSTCNNVDETFSARDANVFDMDQFITFEGRTPKDEAAGLCEFSSTRATLPRTAYIQA